MKEPSVQAEPGMTADSEPMDFADRRVNARLVCLFGGGCRWYIEGHNATAVAEAWERHSHKHWNRLDRRGETDS